MISSGPRKRVKVTMKETGYRQIWGTVFRATQRNNERGYRQIWGTVLRATLLFCVVIAFAVGWFRFATLGVATLSW